MATECRCKDQGNIQEELSKKKVLYFLHFVQQQPQVKIVIRKSENRGRFLHQPEQICPVYKTNVSVGTEMEELPMIEVARRYSYV